MTGRARATYLLMAPLHLGGSFTSSLPSPQVFLQRWRNLPHCSSPFNFRMKSFSMALWASVRLDPTTSSFPSRKAEKDMALAGEVEGSAIVGVPGNALSRSSSSKSRLVLMAKGGEGGERCNNEEEKITHLGIGLHLSLLAFSFPFRLSAFPCWGVLRTFFVLKILVFSK